MKVITHFVGNLIYNSVTLVAGKNSNFITLYLFNFTNRAGVLDFSKYKFALLAHTIMAMLLEHLIIVINSARL